MNPIFNFCFSNIWRSVVSMMVLLGLVFGADYIVTASQQLPSTPDDTSSAITSSEETSSDVTSSEETSSEETSSEEVSSEEVSSEATSSKEEQSTGYTGGAEIVEMNGISVAKIDKSKLSYYKNSVNSNTVGWIAIPNTNINYAVVQSSTSNPEYYSTRDYYKNYVAKGASIWADSWCTFGRRSQLKNNTIIYGHNWTNCWRPTRIGYSSDKWFAQLAAYDHLSFAQENPYISFSTNEEEMYWQIFAVFYTDINFYYIDENANPVTLANEAKRRSIFNFDVNVTSGDKILTLSTCTRVYGQRSDQRFVVMAKLMNSTDNLPAVSVTKNPNPKQPQF